MDQSRVSGRHQEQESPDPGPGQPSRPNLDPVRTHVTESIREARLRPEYAALYPGIRPGVWLPATVIGQQLLLWHLTAPATPKGERLIDRKSTRLNSSHIQKSRMPSSA